MKSVLNNKRVKIGLIVLLILMVLLLIIGLMIKNTNNLEKGQNTKLQANVDISSEVIGTIGKDKYGRDLGKVALNFTSSIPIDKIQIENIDGTIIQEDVNSTTYEKEIQVIYGHTHIISVVTSDGKISMHKITKEKPPEPITNPTESSGIRTGNALPFTWEEINEIAEMISNNSSITRNTQEFSLSYKGNNYLVGVGDYTTLGRYQVRILGFNHDTLTSTDAYGEGKNNTYAGISFEYAESTGKAAMNSSNTNSGGWGACALRSTLNNTTINSLENKQYIKEVSKQYIATYYDTNSVTTSNDKLWLLSCSEIWNNAAIDRATYGYAKAKEGEQYKYYANINAMSSDENTNLVKRNEVGGNWWLRSPSCQSEKLFCLVGLSRWLL